MSLKRAIGLDWFDLVIQVGITGMIMIIADSASQGQSEGAIAAVVAVSLGILAWRRSRALKRMGSETGEVQLDRLQELDSRVTELEIQQGRMLELEERLDFAERLLAQQRDPSRLGAGEQR
jgi:hypothetical protein